MLAVGPSIWTAGNTISRLDGTSYTSGTRRTPPRRPSCFALEKAAARAEPRLSLRPDAELITSLYRLAIPENDFHDLLASDMPVFFILQSRDDLLGTRVDHLSSR